MSTITTSTASVPTEIFYQDLGSGRPVVLIHGWPMSHRMWEPQVPVLTNAGFRTVAYDRRGFGHSGFPSGGYDYDTLAADLNDLLTELDLRDVTLVGFSMGGGEVARYLSRYGTDRVSSVALISAVTPFLMQTESNPDGAPPQVFETMLHDMTTDRLAFLQAFGKQFFNAGLLSHPVSQGVLDYAFGIASMAQPLATVECAKAFAGTDFRPDMAAFTVPTLIVHGSADQTVPIEVSGERAAKAIPSAHYEIIDGAPHGLYQTHPEAFNRILLDFLGATGAPALAAEVSGPGGGMM
ncbi:MAG TPA: alpha/beta hydrolase [Rubricoccaceae bacterium]|jgi:pimeloyl-ACP methyl ester carboxylesterase